MKTNLRLFFAMAAISLLVVGCSKDDESQNSTTENQNANGYKVSLKIPSGAQLNSVIALYYYNNYVLASVKAKPGENINLYLQDVPANMLSKVSEAIPLPTPPKISDNSAMITQVGSVIIQGYDATKKSCYFELSNLSGGIIIFIYSDRTVKLSGHNSRWYRDNLGSDDFETSDYNVTLNKGWNMVNHQTQLRDTTFYYSNGSKNTSYCRYIYNSINSIPTGYEWYVSSY